MEIKTDNDRVKIGRMVEKKMGIRLHGVGPGFSFFTDDLKGFIDIPDWFMAKLLPYLDRRIKNDTNTRNNHVHSACRRRRA